MVSWFANALMRGFDEGRARSMEHSRYRRVEKLLGWAALALELGYKVAAGFVALVGAVLTMALVGWLIERVGMVVAGG